MLVQSETHEFDEGIDEMQRLIYGGYHEKQEIWFWCKILGLRKLNKRFLTELNFMLLNQRFHG